MEVALHSASQVTQRRFCWSTFTDIDTLPIELQTNPHEDFTITEKAPTRAFGLLRVESTYWCFHI